MLVKFEIKYSRKHFSRSGSGGASILISVGKALASSGIRETRNLVGWEKPANSNALGKIKCSDPRKIQNPVISAPVWMECKYTCFRAYRRRAVSLK